MHSLKFHAYVLSLVTLISACGDKGAGDTSSSSDTDTTVDPDTTMNGPTGDPSGTTEQVTESGDDTSAGPTTESPTSATSEPGTTTGPQETTTGPVETTTGPVDTTTTEGSETSDGSSTLETLGSSTEISSSGGVDVCGMLNAQACMVNPACLAIMGAKVNAEKMCSAKPSFLGCVEAMGCGDAITYACDPEVDPPEPFVFQDTCIPVGWENCESPEVKGPCK